MSSARTYSQALLHSPCLLLQVCQAYDAAEFCRNVHESGAWRNAALRACILLGGDCSVKVVLEL